MQMRIFLPVQSPPSARPRCGTVLCTCGTDHCFFAPLVSQRRGSITDLKQKPERTGASLSPKCTAHNTRAAWLCTERDTYPTPSALAPRTHRQGPCRGTRCSILSCSLTNNRALVGGGHPRTLCDPFPTPVASVERFVPPKSTFRNIPELHSSGSRASPNRSGGRGD